MRYLALVTFLLAGAAAQAGEGLVIHASEFGVGKFHRYDNTVHPYDGASAWRPYILPANAPTTGALTVNNDDGSVSIFYSTLDDMIQAATQVSKQRGMPISVLNVHGHGLPGAMWFPADKAALASADCGDWQSAASGSDQDNYNQYYSPVDSMEIQEIRQVSNMPTFKMGCTTGLSEWQSGVAKSPGFKAAFAPDAQVRFLSCVVGLGSVGDTFASGIAALLLPQGSGHVEASMDFGLGDWSMDEGMGFWDMQTQAQLDHDNEIYPKDRKDREIMQKGTIRLASYGTSAWGTSQLANQDFMILGFQSGLAGIPVSETPAISVGLAPPARVRVIGTKYYANVRPK